MVCLFAEVHVAGKNVLEKMERAKADQHCKQSVLVLICQKKTFGNEFEENKSEKKSGAEREQRSFKRDRPP